MDLFLAGSRPATKGDPNWFTGQVWIEPINTSPSPARSRSIRVMFEPGARTAWHSHPLGQTLYVISGVGMVGTRNAPPRVMRVGDTVWIGPGEEHWHGAVPDSEMEHIAIQEAESGFVTTWMEYVSDEECLLSAD